MPTAAEKLLAAQDVALPSKRRLGGYIMKKIGTHCAFRNAFTLHVSLGQIFGSAEEPGRTSAHNELHVRQKKIRFQSRRQS